MKTKKNKEHKIKKPFYKKWWFWLIIAVVVIGAIGGAGGSNSDKSDNEDITIVEEQETSETTVIEKKDVEEETTQETKDQDSNKEKSKDDKEESKSNKEKKNKEDSKPDKEKKSIEKIITKRIDKEFTMTDIDRITINDDLGTDKDGDYIALVYLTWTQKNRGKTSKEVLQMYSDDLAATVGKKCKSVNEIAVFWTVPYLDASAKCQYERNGDGMAYGDMVWDQAFNN